MLKEPDFRVPQEASIFTTAFFKMPETLEQVRLMDRSRHWVQLRYDHSDLDLVNFLHTCAAVGLGDASFGVHTRVGFTIEGAAMSSGMDPINTDLMLANYVLEAARGHTKQCFPTPALHAALVDTDLAWVDVEAFRSLPDTLTIRLPETSTFQLMIGGGLAKTSDVLLYRVKVPGLRRHTLLSHDVDTDAPNAEVWHWITQSRDEITEGIQVSFFGSFVIHESMKLDDILREIKSWSERQVKHAEKQVTEQGLLTVVDEQRREIEHLKPFLDQQGADEAAHMIRQAGFLESALSQVDQTENERERFCEFVGYLMKFVLYLGSEQLYAREVHPLGYRPQKTSVAARHIQAKLLAKFGVRTILDIPFNQKAEDADAVETHTSPTRHRVRGFFRKQAYGPGNALRKVIWVMQFWRGKLSL